MGDSPRFARYIAVCTVIAALGGLTATVGDAVASPAGTPRRVESTATASDSGQLLFVTEGNRVRRIDVDSIDTAIAGTGSLAEDVLIERAASDPDGRDVNGQMCARTGGGFIAGEDTDQPHPPPGWGVFDADGTQVGKLTATYFTDGAEPHGCAFDADGRLFTSEVGFQGFGTNNGQLIQWFPPFDRFPGAPGAYPDTDAVSTNFCKLASDLGTAGGVAVDAEGRVYVAESSGLRITRFSPPFPSAPNAAGGCGNVDSTGAPVATAVPRETFAVASDGMLTFAGIALAPNGHIYASSVLTGRIAEYDLDGDLVRLILAPAENVPPVPTGHPQDIAVGADGTIYYADLDLVGSLPDVGPGPNGKIWRIRFDAAGDPLPPELVRQALAFPDGVALSTGNLETDPLEWPTLAGGPVRRFHQPGDSALTPAAIPGLVERWRFPTDAVVTASPSVASIRFPGATEPVRTVFANSWDQNLYAIDWATGIERWRFEWEDQPGASFPGAGSPTVADVDGRRVVFLGAGEYLYAIDAATGAQLWRFAAGTGCRDLTTGAFPGQCDFAGERNQVETTPLVHQGLVYFGMDVNDVATGKGGFYALDAARGTLVWYFDPESGAVCRPEPADEHGPGDEIRRFDGYHSEVELGLPATFFASRSGCDHLRTRNGCGNVWSSPALDADRGRLYFGTSNCDTDTDPATSVPPPPMPPYDEALVALKLDGTPAWRWRPREVDNDDLAFGAAPNLFTIRVDGQARDVVGIGNKDGTYTVIDRSGVNAATGARWDGPDAAAVPYWSTKLVPGGEIGGVIATASVDQGARRVHLTTAPGFDVIEPQRPTVHSLDLDTGAVVWQNVGATGLTGDASYGPTSSTPGVVIAGSVITPHLRFYDATDGTLLADRTIGQPGTFSGIASGAAVVDGTLVVGAGIGARSSGGSSPGDFAAYTPSAVVALCVPGVGGCCAPTLVPGDARVTEGDDGTAAVRVPIALDAPAPTDVTVEWDTLDGYARAPGDYRQATGAVTIPAGASEAFATVRVAGDRLDEARETFAVAFHDPVGAQLGGFLGLGIVTIVDDDPLPSLTAGIGFAVEGTRPGTVEVPVSLDAPSGRRVTATWTTVSGTATSGHDFTASAGTVTFHRGETRALISVPIVDDERREWPEFFLIELANAPRAILGPDGRRFGVAVIFDDDA